MSDQPYIGQRITNIRPMTDLELAAEGWDEDYLALPAVLELENGNLIYPSRDDAGNGPGALFGMIDGEAVRILGSGIPWTPPEGGKL